MDDPRNVQLSEKRTARSSHPEKRTTSLSRPEPWAARLFARLSVLGSSLSCEYAPGIHLYQAKAFRPSTYLLGAGIGSKSHSGLPSGAAGQGHEEVYAVLDIAAARGTEGIDGDPIEVIALQERVDDVGSLVVPNRISQEDDIVLVDVLDGLGRDLRTDPRIVPLGGGTRVPVIVRQILLGIGLGRLDGVQVAPDGLMDDIGNALGIAGGGEIGDEDAGVIAAHR